MKYKITKQEHLWTREEKLEFIGAGEWVEEADLIEFEYSEYSARVIRALMREPFAPVRAYFGGHLCGYVKIPDEHPYFKKDYDKIDIYCHGSLTFEGFGVDGGHWIGYDCAHSGDCVPSMEHWKKNDPELIGFKERFPLPEGFERYSMFNPKYRNMEYCIENCISMIDQLIDIKKESV